MSEHLGTVGFAFNSSAMNVISGLTSTLGAYLKHAFPRNYFKHTFIGHSSVSMDPGKNDLGSEDIHKRVPRMAIVPSFNIEVPEMGGAIRMEKLQRPIGRVLTESVTHANALYLYCEDERVVRYDLTRMRMSFEITMTVETPLQAANVAAILDNSIYPEQWFFINRTPVPVEIPPLLLGLLAKDMDIDLSRPEDVSELMAHLDAHSMARVDHRVNPANGRSTASFYWPGNTLARFERPSVTPNRVEQSVADTTVTVSAALEYSYPDYWICVVKNTKKSDLDRLLEEADEKGWREEGGAVIVTIPIRLHPEREIGDMTLRFWQGFQVEANRIVDRLPFGSLVDRDLLSFIRDNADDVDLLERSFIIRLYNSDYELYERSEDAVMDGAGVPVTTWRIDWKAETVHIRDGLPNQDFFFGMWLDWRLLEPYVSARDGARTEEFEPLPKARGARDSLALSDEIEIVR